MAQNEENTRGGSGIYFIVGLVLLAVIIFGVVSMSDAPMNTGTPDTEMTTTEPAAGEPAIDDESGTSEYNLDYEEGDSFDSPPPANP